MSIVEVVRLVLVTHDITEMHPTLLAPSGTLCHLEQGIVGVGNMEYLHGKPLKSALLNLKETETPGDV